MRVIFSSTPAHGHLLPMLPLARAFRRRGDDVAVMTAASFAPLLAEEGITLLPVGPEMDALFAEVSRRTGVNAVTDPAPELVAELFAGTRVDLTVEDAVAAAGSFAPDLIVSEAVDFVGPLVAAQLGVPAATHAFGPAIPPEFTDGMSAVAARRFADRDLTPTPARWYIDPCPDVLQPPGWQHPARVQLRPEPHQAPGSPALAAPVFTAPAPDERPKVLVTFGTYFSDPKVLAPILTTLAEADTELRVTLGLTAKADDYGTDASTVEFVGFTPLAELLRDIRLVVTHGGAGTTLGTLSRGVPLVVVPQGADQFLQAGAVMASGTGLALMPDTASPETVAEAARTVLADPTYTQNARKAAEQIAAMPSPDEVAEKLASALA